MAKKIHTKKKRYFGSPAHHKGIRLKSRKRSIRPRTFRTEEAAKAYAEKQGMKNYEIVNLRGEFSKEKKLKIVVG